MFYWGQWVSVVNFVPKNEWGTHRAILSQTSKNRGYVSKLQSTMDLLGISSQGIYRVASGVRKINDFQFFSPHYRLIIDFSILYRLLYFALK